MKKPKNILKTSKNKFIKDFLNLKIRSNVQFCIIIFIVSLMNCIYVCTHNIITQQDILNSFFVLTLLYNIHVLYNRLVKYKDLEYIITNSSDNIEIKKSYNEDIYDKERMNNEVKNYVHTFIEVNDMTIAYPLLLNCSLYIYYLGFTHL